MISSLASFVFPLSWNFWRSASGGFDGSGATHPFLLSTSFIACALGQPTLFYCMRPMAICANTSFSPPLRILLRSPSSCGILIPPHPLSKREVKEKNERMKEWKNERKKKEKKFNDGATHPFFFLLLHLLHATYIDHHIVRVPRHYGSS